MRETSALVELLERKGVITKQDVLHKAQELRQRDPTAIPPYLRDQGELEAGKSLIWVNEQLGHSSIQVTVDTYGHFFDQRT